jgi:hypothetical protein
VENFALLLIAAVPVLYGLFWWLDYRWLSQQRAPEAQVETDPDDEW